jgi:hypothetical protein
LHLALFYDPIDLWLAFYLNNGLRHSESSSASYDDDDGSESDSDADNLFAKTVLVM